MASRERTTTDPYTEHCRLWASMYPSPPCPWHAPEPCPTAAPAATDIIGEYLSPAPSVTRANVETRATARPRRQRAARQTEPTERTEKAETPTAPKARESLRGIYAAFYKALAALGANAFCAPCYARVMPEHSCPDWSALGLPTFQAAPVVVTFDGGLEAEPEPDGEPVEVA